MNKRKRLSFVLMIMAGFLFLALALFTNSNYILSILSQAVIYSILAVSLQLIFGYAGQVSLAHAAFFGIGGYTSAILTLHLDWPFLPAIIVSGLMSAVCSLLLWPMAKLNEIYFAMSTLAFNLIAIILFSSGGKWTGGWNGLTNIPPPNLFGWVLTSKKEFLIISFIVLIVEYLFMVRLTSGRLGRNFRAIRDNQLAAASVGIQIGATKTKGFILGCFWAGLAGSLMVHTYAFVSPEPFNILESVAVILMVVLGGLGSFFGALLGGFGVTFLNEWLMEIPFYRPILYGIFIILMMIYWPNGLYGLFKKIPNIYGKGKTVYLKDTEKEKDKDLLSKQSVGNVSLKDYFFRENMNTKIILQTESLTKHFGGIKAVQNVNLTVNYGDVFGLIGPNGAGKTTFINIVSGLEKPTTGNIVFQGKNINRMSMSEVGQNGLVRTFQTSRLFNSMTVLENVVCGTSVQFSNDIGLPLLQNRRFKEEEKLAYSRSRQLLSVLGLEFKANLLCSNLSYGHRRLVEIARALAAGPSMLILDEPAAGLNLQERDELKHLIYRLRDEFGITLLIIEHDLRLLTQICNRMAVLNFGELIAEGNTQNVISDPNVVQAYLGRGSKKYAQNS